MFGLPRFMEMAGVLFWGIIRDSTHPVYASLDQPLSGFAAKRVEKKRNENPLYARSGERGDERSDVGVSR